MQRKKRKLDEFLSQRRKNPETVLAEKTDLSNQLFRMLVATGLMVCLGALVFLSRPLDASYVLGLGLLLSSMTALGWTILRRSRNTSLRRPAAFNKFVLLVAAAAGLHSLVFLLNWSPFLAPVPLLGMVVALAYGPDLGLLFVLAFSCYAGITSPRLAPPVLADGVVPGAPFNFPFDAPLSLVLLAGGLAAILGMRTVRKQSKPVVVGFVAGAVQASMLLACELMAYGFGYERLSDSTVLKNTLVDPAWAFANGLISGGIVTSLLPAIEPFFEALTDRRLLDLADPSNDLLRVLRERAPGTYQHTLGVAQLASNAAEAIGANRLLAEVGAYYHDVGKIFKPEYFVENMGEDKTIHERLRPSMSKMVIISHVKDGMELAREAKLPEQIVDMIPMHHGTTIVEYFYQKARREVVQDEESPAESEYRYPGSKPRFREAGILMLADNVEAIAKTETDPNPIRFRTLVHAQIWKRLTEGQLNESDLTMNELRLIEDSFVRTLTTMYHSRIRYPTGDEAGGENAAQPAAVPAAGTRERR